MKEGICGICPVQCQVALDIEDGRIKKIKNSEKNLITINKIFYTKNRVTLLSITRKILVSAP